MNAPEALRRKADDYRALMEEHAEEPEERKTYEVVELALREVADALERADFDERRAA